MQPRPCSETSSPCPSVRVSTRPRYPRGRGLRTAAIVAAGHGRPEAENLEVAPRQASRDARDQRAEGERLPEVRAAEAAASRLPDLRHVQGPRRRAAPYRRSVARDPHRGRRDGRRPRPGRDRRGRARGARATRSCRSSSATRRSTRTASSCTSTTERDRDGREAGRGRAREAGQLARRRGPRRRRGPADAVVSAGNTGAMLAAGLLELRRIPGVMRPAIAVPIPAQRGPVRPARRRRERRRARPSTCSSSRRWAPSSPRRSSASREPEVRLLSIGEEPEKGNQLTLEAHELLARERPQLRRQRRGARPPRAAPPTSSSPTASPATSR